MKSLSTLIKLQKSKVDDQRLLLEKLRDQLTKIESDIVALQMEKLAQQTLVSQTPEMGLTYGAYIEACLKREDLLERKRRTAELAVRLAHDKLAELFEEQKRYELAEQARREKEAKAEVHKETLFLDEIGSVAYARKKK